MGAKNATEEFLDYYNFLQCTYHGMPPSYTDTAGCILWMLANVRSKGIEYVSSAIKMDKARADRRIARCAYNWIDKGADANEVLLRFPCTSQAYINEAEYIANKEAQSVIIGRLTSSSAKLRGQTKKEQVATLATIKETLAALEKCTVML